MAISVYHRSLDNYKLFRKHATEVDMAAFTGAGTSVIPGIPTWKSFLRRLKTEVNVDVEIEHLLTADDVYGAATAIYNAAPDHFYGGIAELIQADQQANFHDIHGAVWIAFDRVITTNYDSCFERAMNQRNAAFARKGVEADALLIQELPTLDFEAFRKAGKALAYLHGKAGSQHLVLRSEDYQKYYPSCHPGVDPEPSANLEQFLRDAIGMYSFVFIGFSLEDEDFVKAFEQYREHFKEQFKSDPEMLHRFINRRHFIFLTNDELKDWVNGMDIHNAKLSFDAIMNSNMLKRYDGDPERLVFRPNFRNSFARAGLSNEQQAIVNRLHETIEKHKLKLDRLRKLNVLPIRLTGADYKLISDLIIHTGEIDESADTIELDSF